MVVNFLSAFYHNKNITRAAGVALQLPSSCSTARAPRVNQGELKTSLKGTLGIWPSDHLVLHPSGKEKRKSTKILCLSSYKSSLSNDYLPGQSGLNGNINTPLTCIS